MQNTDQLKQAKKDVVLSIIIVNWNSCDVLKKCLKSIYETIKTPFEVIVVDNNSSDGSISYIRSNISNIIFLVQKENLGFSKANNIGFNCCNGEFVLILNPDTILLDSAVEIMLQFLKKHQNIGIVGPKIIDLDGNISTHAKRRFPTLCRSFATIFLIRKCLDFIKKKLLLSNSFCKWLFYSFYEKSEFTDSIEGSCMLIRRAVYSQLKGFDENVPMYLDDIDLCYRSIQSGFKNYYFAEATILHIGRHSTNKTEKQRIFYELLVIYAELYFFRKHYGLYKSLILKFLVCFSVPILLILDIASVPYYILKNNLSKPILNVKKHILYLDLIVSNRFRYRLVT